MLAEPLQDRGLVPERNCAVYRNVYRIGAEDEVFLYVLKYLAKAMQHHAIAQISRHTQLPETGKRPGGCSDRDGEKSGSVISNTGGPKGLGPTAIFTSTLELTPPRIQAAHRPHSPLSSRDRSHNFWLGHENTATPKSPFCFQSIPFTSFDRQPPLYKTTTEPALGNRCPINPNLREHLTLLFPPTPIRASLHQHPSPELPRLGKAPRHQDVALQLPLLRGEISRD